MMQTDRYASDSLDHPPVFRRIAWVTPDYPPDHGGVSDHSSAMVRVLRTSGHDVLVCSRPHERGFNQLNAELAAYDPDLVVVAYVPLGFAPRTGGIAPAFTIWTLGIRRRLGCQALLLAHEASLPLAEYWRSRDLKLAALAAAQIVQFSVLAANFDAVLFSNLGTRLLWAQRIPPLADRFHTIRICSNIPYQFSNDPAAELRAADYSVPEPTILFFGTGHQSVLFDYVEKAFVSLLEREPSATLVIVGMTPDKLRQLRPSLAARGAAVQALGYVAAPLVSLWLQVATLVLAPLVEGVSARKGTVMAALQHGKVVVTTRGVHTLEDIAWDQICVLAPLDCEAFAAKTIQAYLDPQLRSAIGSAARSEYNAHASEGVTALRVLACANQPKTAAFRER